MLTFKELIAAYATHTELEPKVAEKAIRGLIEFVATQTSKGEKLRLPGLGTFEVKKRPARAGRNPQTGAAIKIKASSRLTFKQAATLAVAAPPAKKGKAKATPKAEKIEKATPKSAAKAPKAAAAPKAEKAAAPKAEKAAAPKKAAAKPAAKKAKK